MFINPLRHKIEAAPAQPQVMPTEPGVGDHFEPGGKGTPPGAMIFTPSLRAFDGNFMGRRCSVCVGVARQAMAGAGNSFFRPCIAFAQRLTMKPFRTWCTPGSVVLAMLVALLWLHQLHLALRGREALQILVVCLTFAGLWVLAGDPSARS